MGLLAMVEEVLATREIDRLPASSFSDLPDFPP